MIIKRGKRYQVRVWVADPSTPNGRRKETVGTYSTRGEARKAEAKAISEQPASRPRAQWTIAQFATRWLDVYHGPGTERPGDKTLRHNTDALRTFLRDHGHRKLSNFTKAEAKNYAGEFAWRAKVVAAMFSDAVDDEKVADNPFRGIGIQRGKGRSLIDPLTPTEIEELATIAERTLGFYGPHFASFIRLAGWTGMRPGELCRLEWGHIDWDDMTIRVYVSKTKEPRIVPIAPRAARALEGIVRDGDKVFYTRRGKPMHPHSYRFYWVRVRSAFEESRPREHWLSRRLRENPDDKLDVYELRHAFGSFLARQGLSAWQIAEILGNSARICEETYIHPLKNHTRDVAREAFARWESEQDGAHVGRSDVRESA